MTPASPTRPALRVAALLAAAVGVLALGACDEAVSFDRDEHDFTFRASTRDICPEPGGNGEAEVSVIVFGPNGDVVEGEPVSFETTFGVVDPDHAKSDRRGKVAATLSTPRAPTVTVTADVKSSGRRTLDFAAPAPMEVRGPLVANAIWTDGDDDGTIEVIKQILVISPCHVQEVRFRLSYDPAIVSFQQLQAYDNLGAFLGDGGTASANDLGGMVEVTLTRDPSVSGFTVRGAQTVATELLFHGVSSGLTDFFLSDVHLIDPLGNPYDVAVGLVAPAEVDFSLR